MPKPKTTAKKKPRKVCRCHGLSQRVSVIIGTGGGALAPVVHQVGVPMQAPTVPPQFVFPIGNGIGDPRFATDREKVRRDDHHYDRVGSAGRIKPTPRMTQSDTADVTRETMTPLERFRAVQQGEINVSILELTKNQLVDRVVALRLERQARARKMSVAQLRGMLEARKGQKKYPTVHHKNVSVSGTLARSLRPVHHGSATRLGVPSSTPPRYRRQSTRLSGRPPWEPEVSCGARARSVTSGSVHYKAKSMLAW